MIKSMTGYGRGEATVFNRRFNVEIKSVNHRYNDVTIKMPKVLNFLEEMVRRAHQNAISRGKTDIYVSFESFAEDDVKINVNLPLADVYVEKLRLLNERYGLKDEISLSLITRFPDVLTLDKNIGGEELEKELREGLSIALDNALENILEMRKREGLALKTDILTKKDIIISILDDITKKTPGVVSDYAERLKNKVKDALSDASYDEQRLITEITIFADKCCIDEELTRLYSHLNQLAGIFEETEPVGRKLDFLVQEMNREANTIGSKAGDLDIIKLCVRLKSEIEKIREQVQNIE